MCSSDLLHPFDFSMIMCKQMDEDNDYLKKIVFSDEATFHISGRLNRHNCRICGSCLPDHETNSLKVNVLFTLSSTRAIGSFFFAESIINSRGFLDMLENYTISHLTDNRESSS